VLQASPAGDEIHLEATVIADLPQHRINYTFTAVADRQLCSISFRRRLREGSGAWDELLEFDQEKRVVRSTRDGRTSQGPAPPCARDPLTQLYFFRQQLATGKVPVGTPQAVGSFYLGSDYSLRYEAVTPEPAKPGAKQWDGERFLVTYRGPDGENAFEVWIRPDPSRTPAAARMAFPLAIFSAELQ
jgi:hypothetical protein